MHTKLTALTALLAVLAVGVFASTASAKAPPRVIHDVKVEILHQYSDLLNISRSPRLEPMPKAWVECHPLSDTLYRCGFMGQSFFYTVMGDAKVRVYKYGTDVTLFNVKCYNGPKASLDYCNR